MRLLQAGTSKEPKNSHGRRKLVLIASPFIYPIVPIVVAFVSDFAAVGKFWYKQICCRWKTADMGRQ